MFKHGLRRRLALLASATALLLPLGIVQAGAVTPAAAKTASAEGPIPGAYISPWGSADVEISPAAQQWLEREGITLETISPFTMHPDGKGFSMPIGSTAGDGLDSKGRIYYPGGLRLRHAETGQTVTLKPTWIRVMPKPGYSAGLEVNGRTFSEETQIADTDYYEVMKGARPSPTGFRLEKMPFYFTQEVEDMIETHSDIDAPDGGTLLGTLTPHFDYIPGQPTFPGLPG